MVALSLVLNRTKAGIVHLIHSYVGYSYFGSKYFRSQLPFSGSLLVSAFCPHVHESGVSDGYFRYIPDLDQVTHRYICDNEYFAEEISNLYALSKNRIVSLKYPVNAPTPKRLDRSSNKRQSKKVLPSRTGLNVEEILLIDKIPSAGVVLWASRMDFQKNPKIAIKVATLLPEYEFHFYGRAVMNDNPVEWTSAPANVTYKGEFFGFGGIDVSPYSAFLYTARFDGMPNIILEAAVAGLPIVSSSVGGISEFLDESMGILVANYLDADEYAAALKSLMIDRDRRLRMSKSLQNKVRATRSFKNFVDAVSSIPDYRAITGGG